MSTTSTAAVTQRGYSTDDVYKFLKASVDLAIGSGEYHHSLLSELHKNIIDYAKKKIDTIRPATHKSIVSCTIVQNTGAGFNISNAMHWDDQSDSLTTFKFQNQSMIIVVSAYIIRAQ
ncbi:hypothetical protein J3B02_000045 [Coemansia erecta]|uniref:Dynein light chain n=1 Tax=Coemansia asiatica TaxID=1052880 RepID=A0A9W8CKI0_9FUNG|nr:hypothetical protein LPJ64_001552 [Coemansia asiatica]KAJ2858664.1 hypothetical protein J3B02_000045 [Coemansia erecta]KAJ2878742.1 hypothetical protein FB639_003288 [Coemansia asiatica]